MKGTDRIQRWLDSNEVHPQGLWFFGADAFSYWLLIARKEFHGGKRVVRLLLGPRASVTTQKHRSMIRRQCGANGVPLIDEFSVKD